MEVDIRRTTCVLFGELCRFGLDEVRLPRGLVARWSTRRQSIGFVDQIHDNIAVLICHCNDPQESVSTVRSFLRAVGRHSRVCFAGGAGDVEEGGVSSGRVRMWAQVAARLSERMTEAMREYDSVNSSNFGSSTSSLCTRITLSS